MTVEGVYVEYVGDTVIKITQETSALGTIVGYHVIPVTGLCMTAPHLEPLQGE